ncbi:MAG: hypothetical protein K5931_11110 [Lachnospiraceae bacterium]|nr:hypothetical protein [Lachnospiraceae bacterium]
MGRVRYIEVYIPQIAKKMDLKCEEDITVKCLLKKLKLFCKVEGGEGIMTSLEMKSFMDPEKNLKEEGVRDGDRFEIFYLTE